MLVGVFRYIDFFLIFFYYWSVFLSLQFLLGMWNITHCCSSRLSLSLLISVMHDFVYLIFCHSCKINFLFHLFPAVLQLFLSPLCPSIYRYGLSALFFLRYIMFTMHIIIALFMDTIISLSLFFVICICLAAFFVN